MKPGDSIMIPGYGEYFALSNKYSYSCTSEFGSLCEGTKNKQLCIELPCDSFDQPLVFFKVDRNA